MGGSTHSRLLIHREEPRPVCGDDRSTPKCRRESRGPASPRQFRSGIASSQLRQAAGAFAGDESAQTIMNERCALAGSGHPLGFFDQLLVQINRRTHSTPRDARSVHHVMHNVASRLTGVLSALKICRAFFQERAHPFLCVVAGAQQAEEGGFEELAFFERHLDAVVDGFDGGADR